MCTAFCIALIGALLPLALSLHLAWRFAFKEESRTLYEYSSRMLERAKRTLNQTRNALIDLDSQQKNKLTCTPDLMSKMRKVATRFVEIKSISYFDQNNEMCTSCGSVQKTAIRQSSQFILPDGLRVALNVNPAMMTGKNFIAVRKTGHFDIFIDPQSLSNIIVPETVWLAGIFDKTLITSKHAIIPRLYQKIIEKLPLINLNLDEKGYLKSASKLIQYGVYLIDNHMVSISHYGPFYFVAAQPASIVYQQYKKLQTIILPFGLLSALAIIGLVIYYSRKRFSLKAELQDALKYNEFFLNYQPIVDTQTQKCIGAEALVRWRHTNGQTIAPDFFVPYAEEFGILPAITLRVIQLVFEDMADLLIANERFHISINFALKDFENDEIIKELEARIAQSNIKRSQIWIEITERTSLTLDEIKKYLATLHNLGYVILIDDFGTGFSNLSYLQNLPVNILKIDKSFIDSLAHQSPTSHVTDHIITLAKALDLKLVAEGVEQESQYHYLKQGNVDFIQGYFFSKPLSKEAFHKFLLDHNWGFTPL